jgi:hypothetical protein
MTDECGCFTGCEKNLAVAIHLEKGGCLRVIMPNTDEYPERENVPGPKQERGRDEYPNNSVREKLTHAAKRVPQRTEEALVWSRNSRLTTEAKNEERNPMQRFFGTGAVGWLAKTAVQAIPFPFTIYGPGDVITGVSAGFGRDILSGERLDVVDRFLYLGATLIPGIPATILVDPARFVRRNIEEAIYAKQNKQSDKAIMHAKDAFNATRSVFKETRKKR